MKNKKTSSSLFVITLFGLLSSSLARANEEVKTGNSQVVININTGDHHENQNHENQNHENQNHENQNHENQNHENQVTYADTSDKSERKPKNVNSKYIGIGASASVMYHIEPESPEQGAFFSNFMKNTPSGGLNLRFGVQHFGGLYAALEISAVAQMSKSNHSSYYVDRFTFTADGGVNLKLGLGIAKTFALYGIGGASIGAIGNGTMQHHHYYNNYYYDYYYSGQHYYYDGQGYHIYEGQYHTTTEYTSTNVTSAKTLIYVKGGAGMKIALTSGLDLFLEGVYKKPIEILDGQLTSFNGLDLIECNLGLDFKF